MACDKFIYLCKARLKLCVLLINIFGVDIPYYRKLSVHIDEENLRYTRLTPIFQKLGLHTSPYMKVTRNFRKQFAPNFILCEFAAIQTYVPKRKNINKRKWTF